MEKTKRQLRAEALERLRECRYLSTGDLMCAMAGFGHEPHTGEQWRDALIHLLEDDDMDSAVYVQKCPNAEPPEGDAIEHARWRWKYRPEDSDEIIMSEYNCNLLMRDLDAIADMVERDYVSREAYEDLRDEFVWVNTFLHRVGRQCGTKDVPSLKAYVEQLEAERDEWKAELTARDKYPDGFIPNSEMVEQFGELKAKFAELEAERDEWKAKAEQAQESYIDAKQDRDAWKAKYLGAMNDAEDYKTLWQRSRERSTKSAKRAATVERLRRYQDEELTNKGYTAKVEYPLDELIDLLTDDDGAARSNDGVTNLEWLYEHDDAFAYGAKKFVVDDGYSCCETLDQAHEWLMAPHEDANDVFSVENDVSANDVDANDANATQDSREKLEADITHQFSMWFGNSPYPSQGHRTAVEWLDRQAAITERHWMEIVGASANANVELKRQIDVLTDQLESAHAKNRALKAHISKMQEGRHGWHIKAAKLQAQVDKLTAECGECVYKQEFASIDELQTKVDALTQANADYREEWHRVCRERDDLQRKLHESNRERESLRKQLGIAIDHAHDMIELVSLDSDEGLA